MNKWIYVFSVVVLIGAAAGYYFFLHEPPARYRPVNTPPPPPEYTSLSGITLTHPEATSTMVTLDMVFATGQADFPSGRYVLETASSTVRGQLIVFDRYAHEGADGTFAVPVGVKEDNSLRVRYYLGLLEGEDREHTDSFPIGEDIDIESVSRDGNLVTFAYRTHDRDQRRTDDPRIETEAVIDLERRYIVQEGANVALANEVTIERIPLGTYVWQNTLTAEGEVVEPISPGAFTVSVRSNQLVVDADCNTGTALYTIDEESTLSLGNLSTTERFCESEQENVLFEMVRGVTGFLYNNGRLTFTGKDEIRLLDEDIESEDSGSATSTATTSELEL